MQIEELSYEATSRWSSSGLHYHEAGAGAPLVLLHGSGPGVTGWGNFGGNLPTFAAKFRTIIVDLPGWGGSPRPESGPPTGTSHHAIRALLDELGLERAHLLGNSAGGGVAARFAIDHPERLDRLVMMAPGGLGANVLSPFPAEGIQRLLDFNAQPTRETLVAWLRAMVFDQALVTEELIEERWRIGTEPDALDWSRTVYAAVANPVPLPPTVVPMYAQLGRVAAPTLLLWGRDDRTVPLEYGLLPARQIPDCELHVLPRCGHWVMIEQRQRFESLVMEFLLRPAD